jgi:hypothetical protein
MEATQVKLIAMAAAVAATAMTSAPAQAAKRFPTWIGSLVLTSLTQPCNAVNESIWFVGAKWNSVYRPKLRGAHPNSSLSVIGVRGAMAHVTTDANSNLHGSGTWQGNGVNKYAMVVEPGGATGTYRMTVDPQVVTTRTDTVAIKGMITNFFDLDGCTIRFKAVYYRNVGTD